MKNLLYLLILGILIISCGSDDSDDGGDTISTESYFPMHLDNNWNYDVSSNSINTHFNGTTSLNGYTYNKVVNQQPIFGTIRDAKVRKSGSNYYLSGAFHIVESDSMPPIPVNDLLFLNEGAQDGDTIATVSLQIPSQSLQFETPAGIANVTPYFDIDIKTVQIQKHNTINLNGGQTYNDVLEYNQLYYLQVRLEFSDIGPLSLADHILIPKSQVGKLQQYFANNIGVTRSQLDLNFSNIEYNTTILVLGQTVDLSPYLSEFMEFFEEETLHEVSELTTYNVFE